MSLGGDGPPSIDVRPAERNALARAVAAACLSSADRDVLQVLLFRMDRATR